MINANSMSKRVAGSLLVGGLLKFFTPLKLSFIVGSYTAFFSLSNCVLPLIGAFAGLPGALALFLVSMYVRSLVSPLAFFKLLAFNVPGMVASVSWIEQFRFVRFLVPLVCMVLFIAHPVGGAAWAYALYWLIPAALYFLQKDGVFARSLSSTFVAHAVGSTIWLYADPMAPAVWLGLIPVVAAERLLFACGMASVYTMVRYVQQQSPKTSLAHSTFTCKPEHSNPV